MAVLKKEDLIKKLTAFLGEAPTDEGVALLEDVTDTMNANDNGGEDWKQKYEDNDKAWRKKYIDRFNGKGDDDDQQPNGNEGAEVKTFYESLFENKKEK